MPSSYATDEDGKSLWIEQSDYIATHIASIAYGFHATVFFTLLYVMLRPARMRPRDRRWVGWLFMSIAFFVTGTITLSCSIGFNEGAWVTERGYPGGPLAYLSEEQGRPIVAVGDVAYLLATVLAEGLLLYRVFVLWDGLWYIVTPLALFYITTIVLIILRMVQLHLETPMRIIDLGLITWTSILALNIALPAASALRILMMRRSVHRVLGREHSAVYASAAAIVIETSLPFVVLSIVFLVLYGGRNSTQYLFLPILAQTTCIAPLLIILRSQLRTSDTLCALHGQPSTLDKVSLAFAPTSSQISSIEGDSEQSTLAE